MPVIVRAQSLPADAALAERLQRLTPPVAATPAVPEAVLYVGWFNDKPIAAVWATGPASTRRLQDFGIHAATTGRGVLQRLADEAEAQERAAGRTVTGGADHRALDA